MYRCGLINVHDALIMRKVLPTLVRSSQQQLLQPSTNADYNGNNRTATSKQNGQKSPACTQNLTTIHLRCSALNALSYLCENDVSGFGWIYARLEHYADISTTHGNWESSMFTAFIAIVSAADLVADQPPNHEHERTGERNRDGCE
jgi:hypothetical protein